jgi:hypothetical protein
MNGTLLTRVLAGNIDIATEAHGKDTEYSLKHFRGFGGFRGYNRNLGVS